MTAGAGRGCLLGAAQIEHALDQAVIVEVAAAGRVVSGTEVEEEIPLGPCVAPRLVGHQAVNERLEALGRLAVPDVDHTAIVDLDPALAIGIGISVEPATHREREVSAGMLQPPVVLPKALPLGAHLEAVPVGPEAAEELGPLRPTGPVERGELRVGGDRPEVGPVARDRHAVVDRGSGVVGTLPGRIAPAETGAGQLEEAQGAIPARPDITLEDRLGAVGLVGGALESASGEKHQRLAGGGGGRQPQVVPRRPEQGGVAQAQGQLGQVQRGGDERGIGRDRLPVATDGPIQRFDSHPATQVEGVALLPCGTLGLRQPQHVPAPGPIGAGAGHPPRRLDGRLGVGLGAELGETDTDQGESELRQRLGGALERVLAATKERNVLQGGEGVAKVPERQAIGGALRGSGLGRREPEPDPDNGAERRSRVIAYTPLASSRR